MHKLTAARSRRVWCRYSSTREGFTEWSFQPLSYLNVNSNFLYQYYQ